MAHCLKRGNLTCSRQPSNCLANKDLARVRLRADARRHVDCRSDGSFGGLGGLSEHVADPRFSTGVGLVLHAAHGESGEAIPTQRQRTNGDRRNPLDPRRWFEELFY